MAIKITSACINCGACEIECPNHAIYPGAHEWSLAEGTGFKSSFTNKSAKVIDAQELQEPKEDDFFYIVSEKCTECVGFFSEPQCAKVCPAECCIPDENHQESYNDLLAKKDLLHPKE